MRYADGLATTLAGAAIPYGYALVLWTSGALAEEHHGHPHTREVVVFAAGAVVAYGCLRLAARRGGVHPPSGLARQGLLQAGAIHLASLCLGILFAALAGRIGGDWGWFVPPLVGTGAYLAGTGADEALKLRTNDGG